MSGPRHRWGERNAVSPYKTERECLKGCGLIKVTRHDGGRAWAEFWRDLEKIAGEHEPTPPCLTPGGAP